MPDLNQVYHVNYAWDKNSLILIKGWCMYSIVDIIIRPSNMHVLYWFWEHKLFSTKKIIWCVMFKNLNFVSILPFQESCNVICLWNHIWFEYCLIILKGLLALHKRKNKRLPLNAVQLFTKKCIISWSERCSVRLYTDQ